ncbi:MAG: hypothetical protein M0P73_16285 [Syntrophobacterales bacterium]|jgi:hypothetical protein|nr:hypothetical protein [Syntrophobacterales bacterium]
MFTYEATDHGPYGQVDARYPVTRQEALKILALRRPDWTVSVELTTARARWEGARIGQRVPATFRQFDRWMTALAPVYPNWTAIHADMEENFLDQLLAGAR